MGKDSDLRSRVRAFLMSRAARISPGDAGLPEDPHRRVQGLRRDEVAMLAGVSVEYYTRLERGDAPGASPAVLDSVARALRLDDVEREHWRRLHRTLSDGAAAAPVRLVTAVRPGVQRLLDSMEHSAAFAINRRGDVVAANRLGRAFYAPVFDTPRTPVNHTWFVFGNQPASRDFWVDWDVIADNGAAILRAEIGTGPQDPETSDLVADLLRVEEFAQRWAAHDLRRHTTGLKRVNHPRVGRMDLTYESLHLAGDNDLSILTFGAEPDSHSRDRVEDLHHLAHEAV
ncbi:helix-turn-helix transcriptional regulator [Streptomyces scopuliridis]|uniref:helix-turn-helix transcriptional regulator n=1 Tax=Streptomyces scopuliridis TaxID=452529 RepID=UPI0036C6D51A